jgi:predicted kinase
VTQVLSVETDFFGHIAGKVNAAYACVGRSFRRRVFRMVIIINGSFGVGKTTVARLLRRHFRGSVIFDPEWAGLLLMRLPGWVRLKGSGSDDFQNIELWRSSAVAGARLFRLAARGPVIVPMTFSSRAYFAEVTTGIRRFDPEVRTFCLRASLATVRRRLASRGSKTEGPGSEWLARRTEECVDAHRDPHFGEPVETEDRTALEVAAEIVNRLRQSHATTA